MIKTEQRSFGSISDANGSFKLKPIEPGIYTVIISYVGHDSVTISGIIVVANSNTDLKKIIIYDEQITGVEIVYHRDLIDPTGGTVLKFDAKGLEKLPIKGNITMVLKMISTDFYVNERSQEVYFRGSRAGTTAYYLDGMRVENITLPGMGVGSMQVYAGSVPAQYGDFTGGVVVVESKSYNDSKEEKKALLRYLNETEAPKIMAAKKITN